MSFTRSTKPDPPRQILSRQNMVPPAICPVMTDTSSWRAKADEGFTLVELLVVIAIIGVLAALTLTTVSTIRGKATQVRCISNLRQLGIATSMFMMENKNTYPQVNFWPKDIVPTSVSRMRT